MKPTDNYTHTRRIDWSRARLAIGQPFNSTYLVAEFGVAARTAHRDIRYLREFYGDRLRYDRGERTFFLR